MTKKYAHHLDDSKSNADDALSGHDIIRQNTSHDVHKHRGTPQVRCGMSNLAVENSEYLSRHMTSNHKEEILKCLKKGNAPQPEIPPGTGPGPKSSDARPPMTPPQVVVEEVMQSSEATV